MHTIVGWASDGAMVGPFDKYNKKLEQGLKLSQLMVNPVWSNLRWVIITCVHCIGCLGMLSLVCAYYNLSASTPWSLSSMAAWRRTQKKLEIRRKDLSEEWRWEDPATKAGEEENWKDFVATDNDWRVPNILILFYFRKKIFRQAVSNPHQWMQT